MNEKNNECIICGREFGSMDLIEFHHLVPKSFKGKNGINIHRVCHNKIHATFSERDLYLYYHTSARIVEHPEIQKFVKWIKNKPLDFYDKNLDTQDRRRKRRK